MALRCFCKQIFAGLHETISGLSYLQPYGSHENSAKARGARTGGMDAQSKAGELQCSGLPPAFQPEVRDTMRSIFKEGLT